jgi:membrane associated rhomboid family serine protease
MPDVPLGNYIVMMLLTVTFAMQISFDSGQQYLSGLILNRWSLAGITGYIWLHANVIHIVSNLVALFIFGRRVCLRLGNENYPFAFVFAGIAAAAAHVAFDGRPAIGASGAVMGILGMYVVLCFGSFGRLGPWLILLWFLLNLTAGMTGYLPSAYMGHVGGFISGAALAGFLVFFKIVKTSNATIRTSA